MIIAIITATRKTVGTAEILPVYKTVLSVQDKSACKLRQTTPSQCGLSGNDLDSHIQYRAIMHEKAMWLLQLQSTSIQLCSAKMFI